MWGPSRVIAFSSSGQTEGRTDRLWRAFLYTSPWRQGIYTNSRVDCCPSTSTKCGLTRVADLKFLRPRFTEIIVWEECFNQGIFYYRSGCFCITKAGGITKAVVFLLQKRGVLFSSCFVCYYKSGRFFITKAVGITKVGDFLLQKRGVLQKWAIFYYKSGGYYKSKRLLQKLA